MRRLLIVMLMLASQTLFAQTAEEAVNLAEDHEGFGMRAAGMGNAFIGVADDYSAIYWNPAGLAQLRSGQFYASLQNLQFRTEANYLNNTTDAYRDFTKLRSLGMVYPLPVSRGSLVLAAGFQRFKSFDSYADFGGLLQSSNNLGFNISNEFGDYGTLAFDSLLQQRQTITNNGQLSAWSVGVAMDLSPNFSAGVTLDFIGGGNEYDSRYSQDDVNEANSYNIYDQNNQKIEELYFNYYDVSQKISTDYSGLGVKLGGLFRLNRNLRFGATIHFPVSLTVTEKWSEDDDLSYDILRLSENQYYNFSGPVVTDDGKFDYIIKIPFKFGVGASYGTERFLVSASAEYQDLTQLEFQVPDNRDQRDYLDLLDQNETFRENFRPVLSYAAGGEFKLLHDQLSLRGGYRYVPSPLKNAAKKYDKQYISAGVGYQVDPSTVIEASWVLGQWQQDKAYDYAWEGPAMTTSETYTTQRLLVGLRFMF